MTSPPPSPIRKKAGDLVRMSRQIKVSAVKLEDAITSALESYGLEQRELALEEAAKLFDGGEMASKWIAKAIRALKTQAGRER